MTTRASDQSDEQLLCVLMHDPVAFEELYSRCIDKTVRFAVRRCTTPGEVHDLVAATWLEVIDASSRFDPSRGAALPWILGVMANLANDERRRFAREREAIERLAGQRVLDSDDVARLEEAINASRLADQLATAIDNLPAGEREALELVAFGGLSQEDAARALDVEPSAFRMRLVRARRKLRDALAHENASSTRQLEVT